MGRLSGLCLVVLAACGRVSKVNEANLADAPDPDSLVCTSPQEACGGQCADLTSDVAHCGSCDNACSTAEECISGHCADATASCFAIKQFHPDAPDGHYKHELDGTEFFCDMTHGGRTYFELDVGQYDASHAGYELITLADFQDPVLQQAFIDLYNHQNGAKLIQSWSVGNCCFKYDTSANMLYFGTNGYVQPADTMTTLCGGTYSNPTYRFSVQLVLQPLQLPTDFFSTNAPAGVVNCSNAMNPAFFWKRSAP